MARQHRRAERVHPKWNPTKGAPHSQFTSLKQQVDYRAPMEPPPPPNSIAAFPNKRASGAVVGGAFVAGLATTVLVGVVLAVIGIIHLGKSHTATVDKTPIVLPSELDGYQDALDAMSKLNGGDPPTGEKDLMAKEAPLTVDAYEQAYGGAAAAFRAYANADVTHNFSVIAVRAQSPGLTDGPVSDPSTLGLAVSQRAVIHEGDVSCIVVQNTVAAAGEPVDPANSLYVGCERTGPGLTVIVTNGDFSGDEGRRAIIRLTNAAFDAAAR